MIPGRVRKVDLGQGDLGADAPPSVRVASILAGHMRAGAAPIGAIAADILCKALEDRDICAVEGGRLKFALAVLEGYRMVITSPYAFKSEN